MQFCGTARTVDFDVARRQVIDTLGMMTKFLAFNEVHQVVLAGPPSARLSLRLSLKRGEALEIGAVEDVDFGIQLGNRIAELLGCDFAGVVRVPTLSIRPQETDETQAFVRTVQIREADVLDEISAATSAHAVPDGAPTLEVPALRRPAVLTLFDEAAKDLLANTWD